MRFPGLDPAELPSTSRSAIERMGFAVVEERQPSFLFARSVLITGDVDRATAFETGMRERSHRGGHGNSRRMSPRAEMHRAAGSVRVPRGT